MEGLGLVERRPQRSATVISQGLELGFGFRNCSKVRVSRVVWVISWRLASETFSIKSSNKLSVNKGASLSSVLIHVEQEDCVCWRHVW